MGVLGRWASSYERGTPVHHIVEFELAWMFQGQVRRTSDGNTPLCVFSWVWGGAIMASIFCLRQHKTYVSWICRPDAKRRCDSTLRQSSSCANTPSATPPLLQGRTTSTARAALALEARRRWCLSGTPLQNRFVDKLVTRSSYRMYRSNGVRKSTLPQNRLLVVYSYL